ncbi:MAG: formylglycine-generating enzyme family protein, partial [Gammaproteobacteria bacterium]
FTGFVRQALKREVEGDNPLFQPGELLEERDTQWLIQARGSKMPFKLPEVGVLIPKLSHLAYRMQSQQTAGEGGQVRVGYDEALGLLDHGRDEDIVKAGVAIGVLEHDLDHDEVLYIHQLLQEYFAARELAKAPQPQLVRQPWRADQVTPNLQDTLAKLADSDPLPPLPGTGWEETTLLAAAMAKDPARFVTELMENSLPLAGRCAAQPEVNVSDELKNNLRRALIERTQDPSADLRARIAAGLALGELGDPRFEPHQGPQGEYLLPPLIEIPGGVYSIGSDEGLYEDEAPMHPVELKLFKIGKFPITNGEWALFMKAGGIDDGRWWDTEEAKAWQRGESTAEGPKQQWREDRKRFQDQFDQIRTLHLEGRITSKQADDWEAIARIGDAEFEALLDRSYPSGRQTQPAFWNDDAFNNPGQPVVGVCWH